MKNLVPIKKARRLEDLVSIGPAMLRDFELLGVRSVRQLARQNPARLYQKLCRLTGERIDICCQDVFSAAVAQARNPLLPAEQCQWWYWSRQRKASRGPHAQGSRIAPGLRNLGWQRARVLRGMGRENGGK